jgi:putative ABC transport system substrate-binding protein
VKRPRHVLITLLAASLVCGPAALTRAADQIHRIGFVTTAYGPEDDVFRDTLHRLGWVEGRNLVIEYRETAAEVVQLGVEVIGVDGSHSTAMARQATSTIPIVFCTHSDPVGAGHVASLARPGGNVTGLTPISPDLVGKRLELLKEVVPGLSRVVVLWNAANPANAAVWHETQAAARALGLLLHSQDVRGPQDLEGAFAHTAQARPDALLVLGDSLINMHRQLIAEFATQEHLPSGFTSREWVVAGGLMSYGPHLPDLFRRAAYYVDRILKGAKPTDLPVEQPIKFELVINLKTAQALGITIPPSVLFQANEVIQ